MKITKGKIVFICILFLGLGLRLMFIDRPTGFWYDEMLVYNQASASFPFGIIKETLNYDVHFPLYQLFLSLWMKVFSNNDIAIRLFSVLMGTFTILFSFLVGKELKDEKLGNIFAFLVAINATLLFYSQEVKFYIMLAMLSSIALLAMIRIKNKNDIIGHTIYVLSNIAIVYTFTIGVFYVLAQFIAFLIYAWLKDKKLLKNFLISNAIILLGISPFAIYLLTHLDKYQSMSLVFINNIFTTFVLIQNYFSPALMGVYNNPIIYIPTIGIMPLIFIYLPCTLALYSLYKAIKENKENIFILLIPLTFLLFEIILSYVSGFKIMTRYTIPALIPLLLVVSLGFYYLKSKAFKTIVTFLFIINIFFLFAVPTSAIRGNRERGCKPVASVLQQNKIQNNDIMILSIRKNEFDKYLTFKGKTYSLLNDFLYKDYAYDSSAPDKYEAFRKYIFDNNINTGYEKVFVNDVITPMKKGARIFLVIEDDYNLSPFKDAKNYRNYPIIRLNLSKINTDTAKICDKYLKFQTGFQIPGSKILIFQK